MNTGGTLLKGSILRTADLAALVGASFIITPLLVHSLGARSYGVWMIVGALMGYYGVLEFGLSSAVARYMSQAQGKADVGELEAIAGTGLLLFAGIGAVTLLATAAAVLLCPFFAASSEEAALFERLLIVMGVATAAAFVSKTFVGMLASGIRYDVIALISIARTVAVNAGIYLVLRAGLGIMAVATATLLAGLLQCAGLYAACRLLFPAVRVSLGRAARGKILQLLSYSSKSFACHLGDLLRFRVDSLMIAGFLGAALVTPYAIGGRLVEGFAQLVLSSVGMMLPVFSRYEGRGDYEGMRRALLKVTKLSAVLTAFVGLSVLFYGGAFIERWMGPGFRASYWVACILAVGYLFDLPQSPGIQLLYGISKQEVYALLNICEGVLAVALSYVLLKHWGIYGVAVGVASAFGLFKLLVQPVYVCRAIGLPAREYLVGSILAPAAKSAAALAVFFVGVRRFVSPDYGALALCGVAQTLAFAPVAYFLILGPPEREAVVGALKALARRPEAAEAARG